MSWENLKDFENDYEIFTEFPYQIRKKSNQRIIKERIRKDDGYVSCDLLRKTYYKHRLVAKQWLENTNNYTDVDHINHIKSDNRLENLRWCSRRMNNNNKLDQNFVNEIPHDCTVVDTYGEHEFEFLYFDIETDTFYVYNGLNYVIKRRTMNKFGDWYTYIRNKEGKPVRIYYNKFKRDYGLI